MSNKSYSLVLLFIVSCVHAMQVVPGQKLNAISFTGAAVLPITYSEKCRSDGEPQKIKYVLLSREVAGSDPGTWDTFGGSRDAHETDPIETASHEFEEEAIAEKTLGLNLAAVRNFIDVPNGNTQMVLAKYMYDDQGTSRFYVMYLTEFRYNVIKPFGKKFFAARKKMTNPKYLEKDGIALVRWDDLVNAIKDNPSATRIQVAAHEFDPETNKNKPAKSLITLRPLLVKVLRPYVNEHSFVQGETDKIRFYK